MERKREADKVIDLRGMSCPWSLLKAKSQLNAMDPGEVLEVLSTDPMMPEDFPKVLGQRGHQIMQIIDQLEYARLYVLRGNNEDEEQNNSPVLNRNCCEPQGKGGRNDNTGSQEY